MTLYEITGDAIAIQQLIENAVDEEGNPRDLTENENKIIDEFLKENSENLEEKANAYGKIISNFGIMADNADNERKMLKAEMDRLSKRSKSFANKKEQLKTRLYEAMNFLKIPKIKTALFSFSVKENPVSVNVDNAIISTIPDRYLNKEISKSAIKDGLKTGALVVLDSGEIYEPKSGLILQGVKIEKSKSLQIR